MPVNRKGGRWQGGYISLGEGGQPTFFIEKEIDHVRFHVSTRAHTLAAALKHWERFQADPANYSPAGVVADLEGVHLTRELAEDFETWMRTRPRPASEKWIREVAHRLADWMVDLSGVDLRRATLKDHIKPALARHEGGRQHRIIAIKSFYAWLRKERHVLTSANDPTLDLPVPQAIPEKHRRTKAVPLAHVRKVAPKLALPYRDILVVMADTGMHVTEIERFIRDVDSELVRTRRGDTLAVMRFRHKSRKTHAVAINRREVLEAAERMRKRGEVPRRMNATLARACRAAKVPVFSYGVLRHSVATWLEEQNVPTAQSIRLTGHASEKTFLNFYADVEIPVRGFKTPGIL